MTDVRVLERLAYRAPLALTCADGVTAGRVSDGLMATAWLRTDPATRFTASRSPLSGILGFGSLPRQWQATHAVVGPGEPVVWPPTPPTPFCVRLEDTLGRYLPVMLAVDAPVAAPVDVPLSSAPTRAPGSGVAMIRGEVRRQNGRPLSWALVRVDAGAAVHQTVADAMGRFLLYPPYPDALPPLLGSPPVGPGLSAVTWSLTITVRSQPSALVRAPGSAPADPPQLGSISAQGAAQIVDGGNHPSITATLAFGVPLVLALTAVPA